MEKTWYLSGWQNLKKLCRFSFMPQKIVTAMHVRFVPNVSQKRSCTEKYLGNGYPLSKIQAVSA